MRIKTLISTFLIIGATSTGFTVGVKIIEVKDYKSNIFKAPANHFSISLDYSWDIQVENINLYFRNV